MLSILSRETPSMSDGPVRVGWLSLGGVDQADCSPEALVLINI